MTIVAILFRKQTALYVLWAMGMLSLPLFGAQQPKDMPLPAPVPVSIATAKKVFIFKRAGKQSSCLSQWAYQAL
jgi:hypothetical protein